MRKYEAPVAQAEDGTWGFQCLGKVYVPDENEEPVLDPEAEDQICFRSTGWPAEAIAQERADQHAREHANTKEVHRLRALIAEDPANRELHKQHNALLMEPQKAFERRVMPKVSAQPTSERTRSAK